MLLEKIVLGITLAAPIGPVSLEMIQRGLSHGFWSAFIVRVGGALGNTLCLIMATFGLSFLLQSPWVMNLCALVGALVLVYLGLKSVLKSKRVNIHLNQECIKKSYVNGLATGFFVSIANPIGIMFWISIFAASFDPTAYSNQWMSLVQNAAIILGVILWGAILSGILEVGKRFFNNRMIQIVTFLAGALLIYFGVKFGIRATLTLYTLYFG